MSMGAGLSCMNVEERGKTNGGKKYVAQLALEAELASRRLPGLRRAVPCCCVQEDGDGAAVDRTHVRISQCPSTRPLHHLDHRC